jgi:hypothetical protein
MRSRPIILVAILIIILSIIIIILRSSSPKQITNQPTQAPLPKVSPVAIETIIMKPDSFEPSTLTVKKNTKIIFKNEDSVERWPASNIHPSHGIYPEFDPRTGIKPGEEWSFVFDKIGIWRMHDHLIPSITGTITIE